MTPKKQAPPALNAVDAEWRAEDTALFDFNMKQVVIPSLVIVQPTSRMEGRAKHEGEIYNTVTREFWKQVELAFVGWNTPRAVLPYPFNVQARQLCASPDSVRPYEKYIGQEITASNQYDELTAEVPENCEDCPIAAGGFCTVMYRYFGLQMENMHPFSMRFKRTGLSGARTLNFWLNDNQQKRVYSTFYMTTEKTEGDSGTYYTPKFEVGNDASALLGNAVELNRALQDRVRRAAQAQLTDGSGEE